MAILTKDQLVEIYQNLDSGLVCYYNPETKEIKSIPDSNDPYLDKALWEKQIKSIEKDIDQYWVLEKMSSSEYFLMMKAFIDSLDDSKIKGFLIESLTKSKPFRQFKKVIEAAAPEYIDNWAVFKEKRYCDWLLLQVGEMAAVNK
jgi:hypothetical protein